MLFNLLPRLLHVPPGVTIKDVRFFNVHALLSHCSWKKQRVFPWAVLRNASMMETKSVLLSWDLSF